MTNLLATNDNNKQDMAILKNALEILLAGNNLTLKQMQEVMLLIMNGKCSDILMSAILVALRVKGESINEITAAASVMRELSIKITPKSHDNLVDIVGTGGDGSNLFNVSTASALVASCAGANVAKHGNRSVSSNSGSSDLLDKAGIRLDLTPEQTLICIEEQCLGFLFAPNHHPAIRHAMPVRKALGVRTIFNMLGPLTNPAGVKKAVIGVFDSSLCESFAHVLQNLGDEHILVVSSDDGLDEISLAAPTHVAELKNGHVTTYTISPEDFGIRLQSLDGLQVTSSTDSLSIINEALTAEDDKHNNDNSTHNHNYNEDTIQKARDIIALNAGSAIYVAGCAESLIAGVKKAQKIINSGQALQKLKDFAEFTQTIASDL